MLAILNYASKNLTLPQTSLKLRDTLDDPRSSADDIAKVMSVDPSLSAKVLKLANSALFRFPSEVTSVSKAVNVIGGEATYNISMVETANMVFKSMEVSKNTLNTFWQKSVQTGLIAQSIAQQVKLRGSSRFFVMGVLLNLSELVCIAKQPDQHNDYEQKLAQDGNLPLEEQQQLFGFTFAQVSGAILENWKIPDTLYEPLKRLNKPTGSKLGVEESILYLASVMAEKQIGKTLFTEPNINERCLECVGLNDYEYDIILQFVSVESLKIAQIIN